MAAEAAKTPGWSVTMVAGDGPGLRGHQVRSGPGDADEQRQRVHHRRPRPRPQVRRHRLQTGPHHRLFVRRHLGPGKDPGTIVNQVCGQPGDSGAPVTVNNKLVGMLHGRSPRTRRPASSSSSRCIPRPSRCRSTRSCRHRATGRPARLRAGRLTPSAFRSAGTDASRPAATAQIGERPDRGPDRVRYLLARIASNTSDRAASRCRPVRGLGDVAQQPAHDLAGAGLRQLGATTWISRGLAIGEISRATSARNSSIICSPRHLGGVRLEDDERADGLTGVRSVAPTTAASATPACPTSADSTSAVEMRCRTRSSRRRCGPAPIPRRRFRSGRRRRRSTNLLGEARPVGLPVPLGSPQMPRSIPATACRAPDSPSRARRGRERVRVRCRRRRRSWPRCPAAGASPSPACSPSRPAAARSSPRRSRSATRCRRSARCRGRNTIRYHARPPG